MEVMLEQIDIDAADFARNRLGRPIMKNISRICPLCQALMRMGYQDVTVGLDIEYDARGRQVTLATATGHKWVIPEKAGSFMSLWDEYFPVYPTTLELEAGISIQRPTEATR